MISFADWDSCGRTLGQSIRDTRGIPQAIDAATFDELEALERIIARTIRVEGYYRWEESLRSKIARRLDTLVASERDSE